MNASTARTDPVIFLPALVRSVVPMVIVWGTMVGAATFSHQPGVVCVTPLAWLLAIWAGVQYVFVSARAGVAPSLVGVLVAGLLLGLFMAGVWLLGSNAMMGADEPASELEKARNLNIGISIASLIICTFLALGGGVLARYRVRRSVA
jgi:hypothetical protein